MADKTTGNPLIIDGSNTAARAFVTSKIKISHVDIIASGNSWSYRVLDAQGGNSVLRGKHGVAGVTSMEKKHGPTLITPGWISDLTNITEILIYKYAGPGG